MIPDRLWGAFAAYVVFRTPAKPFAILSQMVLFFGRAVMGSLPKDERPARRVYQSQFRSKSNAKSSKRLVRQSAVWAMGNRYVDPALGERDTAPFYRFIQENISRCWGRAGQDIQVRLLAGRWDPLGKAYVVAQWVKALPQLEEHVTLFDGVGHFVEEERPYDIADTILAL